PVGRSDSRDMLFGRRRSAIGTSFAQWCKQCAGSEPVLRYGERSHGPAKEPPPAAAGRLRYAIQPRGCYWRREQGIERESVIKRLGAEHVACVEWYCRITNIEHPSAKCASEVGPHQSRCFGACRICSE